MLGLVTSLQRVRDEGKDRKNNSQTARTMLVSADESDSVGLHGSDGYLDSLHHIRLKAPD